MIYQLLITTSAITCILLTLYVLHTNYTKKIIVSLTLMLLMWIFVICSFLGLIVNEISNGLIWKNIFQPEFLSTLSKLSHSYLGIIFTLVELGIIIKLVIVFVHFDHKVLFAKDITVSKSREEELIHDVESKEAQIKNLSFKICEQNKQLDSIIDSMSDFCFVVGKDGKYLRLTQHRGDFNVLNDLKQAGDWLKLGKFYDISNKEIDINSIPELRVINGETLYQYKLTYRSDFETKYFEVNGTPVFDKAGEFLFGVIVIHDITEHVIYKEKILFQNTQLETIINTVSDMAFLSISDKDGLFIYYSSIAMEMFSAENIAGGLVYTYKESTYFNQDGTEIKCKDMPVAKVLCGEKVVNFHYVMRKNGEDIHLLFNGTPIFDHNNKVTMGIYFCLNITDHVMHQKLIPINKHLQMLNNLKDKLFTVFTHDIRNPMATMVSLVELLEADDTYLGDSKEILTEVKKQVNYTFNIIENLLDWLNSQREGIILKKNHWKLIDLVQEVVSLYSVNASAKEIEIHCYFDNEFMVFVDKEILGLVLRNIISNAIKFTNQGGCIIISIEYIEKEAVLVINDNGIGMDQEKINQLFDESSSYTTVGTDGEKGIGLGLLICKEFLGKIEGKLWVESVVGEGSTFYISLSSFIDNQEV